MRALIGRELQGVRDNKNVWRIASEELERWMASRPATNHHDLGQRPATGRSGPLVSTLDSVQEKLREELEAMRCQHAEARLEVAVLRADVSHLRERLDEASAERDRWRQMAERLAEPRSPTSALVVATPPNPWGGFLARLFGRA